MRGGDYNPVYHFLSQPPNKKPEKHRHIREPHLARQQLKLPSRPSRAKSKYLDGIPTAANECMLQYLNTKTDDPPEPISLHSPSHRRRQK